MSIADDTDDTGFELDINDEDCLIPELPDFPEEEEDAKQVEEEKIKAEKNVT